MSILEFMGDHPWLTFVLVVIFADTATRVSNALRGKNPPAH